MAGLSFVKSLTPEQLEVARIVGEMALKHNVPPRLAIAVAMRESGLGSNKNDGAAGEIGIMQVLPDTGKSLGYELKDLRDVTKNIEAGVKYLRQNLDRYDNNEGLAVAAYNAGPGRIDAGVVPPKTREYITQLNDWGTFVKPEQSAQPPDLDSKDAAHKAASAVMAAGAPAQSGEDEEVINLDDLDKPMPAARPGSQPTSSDPDRENAGNIGAFIGLSGVGAVGAGHMAARGAKRLGQAFGSGMQSVAPPAAATGAPGVPAAPAALGVPGGAPAAPAAPGAAPAATGELYPKASGPGQMTANYARSAGLPEIEAGKALGMGKGQGEVWDLMNKRGQALTEIGTRFPSGSFAENPAYGGIMTPSASVGSGPRESFVVDQPAPATPEQPAKPGGLRAVEPAKPVSTIRVETKTAPALERVTQALMAPFEGTGNVLKKAAPAMGALTRALGPVAAGYSIGQDIYDIDKERRAKDPDVLGMGLSGLGAVSTGAMFVPGLAPVAAPLAIAAPIAQNVRKQYKAIQADPKAYEETMQRALSNVDPMGNPLP